ncbi:MAG: hypothetical protein R6U89_01750 [Dehalococcoidia bacterium]
MKQIISITLVLVMVLSSVSLAACGGGNGEEETTPPPITEEQETTPTQESDQTPGDFTETEPNDSADQATEVGTGTVTGALTEGDEEDWYAFEVPDEHMLTVEFTPDEDADSKRYELYDPNREEIAYHHRVEPGVTKSITRLMNNSSGGTYYVRVKDGSGSYTLELATESQNDAGSGGDAGDSGSEALEVETGTSLSGQIGDSDQEDWYAFEVPDEHMLSVAFTPDEDADSKRYELYDPNLERINYHHRVEPGVTKSITRLMNNSSGGTYYVRVKDGSGSYTLELATESQNDAGSGGDAGDSGSEALEVETGTSLSGQIGDSDEEDWYAFEVPDEHMLSVAFTPDEDADSKRYELYDPNRERITYHNRVEPGVTKSITNLPRSNMVPL